MAEILVVDVTVRESAGAYVTSTVRGRRCSCTHSAEEAARRLGVKLFGDGLQLVEQIDNAVPGSITHIAPVYRLHGVLEEAHER